MLQFLKIFFFLFFVCQQLNADVLVRMEVQQDAAISNVDMRLFEEDAPLTVANFRKYVSDNDYVNTFIHRSVSGFVVQGGGFSFDPSLGSFTYDNINDIYPGGLQEVQVDPPVQNEFKRSNLRGTIAMAKLGGDPNSSTSQWFINLADNSSILDGQNGGFTVFGEVISNGMDVVDQIAGHQKYDRTDIHNAFGELPLINYSAGPILQQNLVRINTISALFSITADIDFKAVLINTSHQSVITIKNLDTVSHSIGDIMTTDTLNAPFSKFSDSCANTTLTQGAECALVIEFSPQSESVYSDTFNIELTDLALSYSFALAGEGVLTTPAADITPSIDIIKFEDTQLYDSFNGFPDQIVLTVKNDGNLNLNITSVALSGTDVTDFEVIDNCTTTSPVVPGAFCVLPVNFKPLTTGEKSAILTLISDDPDENPLVIPITGAASIDTDGVPVSVEDAAPNDGDGNNDGIKDSIQNNVVSIPATNSSYLTLLTNFGAKINNVTVLTEDKVVTPPDDIQFNLGVLSFNIDDISIGGFTEVGIIIPPGFVPTTYYMYGPTPDNINPHWYEFLFDGSTGAVFIANASITSPSGVTIQRNLIKLVFKDGERGDADLLANGVIVDPGSPVVTSVDTSSSGSMNLLFLFYLFGVVVLLRQTYINLQHWNITKSIK